MSFGDDLIEDLRLSGGESSETEVINNKEMWSEELFCFCVCISVGTYYRLTDGLKIQLEKIMASYPCSKIILSSTMRDGKSSSIVSHKMSRST